MICVLRVTINSGGQSSSQKTMIGDPSLLVDVVVAAALLVAVDDCDSLDCFQQEVDPSLILLTTLETR